MDVEQMERVPYDLLPLYIGYKYADKRVFECLRKRIVKLSH